MLMTRKMQSPWPDADKIMILILIATVVSVALSLLLIGPCIRRKTSPCVGIIQ
jgi:hypothetical protein